MTFFEIKIDRAKTFFEKNNDRAKTFLKKIIDRERTFFEKKNDRARTFFDVSKNLLARAWPSNIWTLPYRIIIVNMQSNLKIRKIK